MGWTWPYLIKKYFTVRQLASRARSHSSINSLKKNDTQISLKD